MIHYIINTCLYLVSPIFIKITYTCLDKKENNYLVDIYIFY